MNLMENLMTKEEAEKVLYKKKEDKPMNEPVFDPRKAAKETVATYYWSLLQDGEFPQHFDKDAFDSKVAGLVADEVFEGSLTIEQAYEVLREIRVTFSTPKL